MKPSTTPVKFILLFATLSLIIAACAPTASVGTPALPTATPLPPTQEPQEPQATGTPVLPTAEPQAPESTPTTEAPVPIENLGLTFTYIGTDGNLWLAEPSGGPARQITTDAAAPGTGGNVVSYYTPRISSDGRYIAVRRDAGVTVSDGVKYQFGLWIYDLQTGSSNALFESPNSPPAGFDWKPGSHQLAYGLGTDPNYFLTRGKPDPALATGIFIANLDSGETELLVEPERGLTLILPTWSPDGNFISFDEVVNMEGRGPFAYYDLNAGNYISWEEPLGNYDWSPDGSTLAYDRMTYTATGDERIYTRPRVGGAEQQVSPEHEQDYAFSPTYSPDGTQLAYLVNAGGPDSMEYALVLQDLSTGETRQLGVYDLVWYLDWSHDGHILVFSAGPNNAEQVYGYNLVNDTITVLAGGSAPSLAKP